MPSRNGKTRGRRWLIRVLWTAVCLALLLLYGYIAVLPGLVERMAIDALEDLGLGPARLQVRSVTFSGAEIADLELGDQAVVAAGHLSLTYDLVGLLDGRLDLVEVHGATVRVGVREGSLDLGPLDALPQAEGGAELPFRTLVLSGSELVVTFEERTIGIPVSGTLQALQGATLALDLRTELLGSSVHLIGTVDPREGTLDLACDGQIRSLGALLSALPRRYRESAGSLEGGGRLAGRIVRAAGAFTVAGSFAASGLTWQGELMGRPLSLSGLDLDLHVPARGDLPVAPGSSFRLEVATRDLLLAGLRPWTLEVSATTGDGGSVAFAGSCRPRGGPGGSLTLRAEVEDPWGAARVRGTLEAGLPQGPTEDLKNLLAELDLAIPASSAARVATGFETRRPPAGEAWGMSLLDGSLDFASSEIRLGSRTLAGCRAAATFRGQVSTRGAELTLDPGARLSATGAREAAGGGWRLETPGATGVRIEFGAPVRVALGDRAAGATWRVQAAAVALVLEPAVLGLEDPALRLGGLTGVLDGTFEVADGRLTGRLDAGSKLACEGPCMLSGIGEISSRGPGALASLELVADGELSWLDQFGCDLPLLRARVAGDDLAVGELAVLSGLEATWLLALDAGGGHLGVRAVEVGAMHLAQGRLRAGSAEIDLGQMLLELTEVRGRPLFSLGREGPWADVEIRCREPVALGLGSLGSGSLSALGLSGSLEPTPLGVQARAVLAARLDAATGAPAEGDGPRLAASNLDLALEAVLDGGGGSPRATATLVAGEAGEVRATWPRSEVVVRAIDVQATGDLAGGQPHARGTAILGDAEIWNGSVSLNVSDISATVPFALGEPVSERGSFGLETIWLGDDLLPPLAGTLAYDEGILRLAMEWPLLPDAIARADGWLDLASRLPAGELNLVVPRFEMTRRNQPSDLLSALQRLELGGTLALDARLRLDGLTVEPQVRLMLEEVSLRSEEWHASATGLNADILLDSFTPLATPGNQRVTVAEARLGKLNVRDGLLVFRLEDAHSLFVEQTSWGWAGGRLSLHAARLDPSYPVLDGVVYAENLDLGELLATLAEGTATGSGTLYGRLPVSIDWPRVTYRDGFLYAAPGIEHMELIDLGGLLSAVPERARVALQDFDYSVLKADFLNDHGEGAARVRLRGRSRDPAFRQEVILDVNVNGFDQLLAGAIIVTRARTGRFD